MHLSVDKLSHDSEWDAFSSEIEKPPFADCMVKYLIWEDGQFYVNDPPTKIEDVSLLVETTELDDRHRTRVAELIRDIDSHVESVQLYLWSVAESNYLAFKEEYDSEDEECRESYEAASSAVNFESPDSLRYQIALRRIVVFDTTPEGEDFIGFEFDVGWDDEHGISVITREGRAWASTGMGDFWCRGTGLGKHVEYIRKNCFGQPGETNI